MSFLPRPAPDPLAVPGAYLAAAKVKLEQDRKSYRTFREIDQREHERAYAQRMAKAVADMEENAQLFRQDVERFEPRAGAALQACRDAQDRAREAREYARQCHAEHERIKGKTSAAEETEALVRADAAEETAFHAEKAAAQAEDGLRAADEALAEAREGLTGAEQLLDRQRQQAARPAGTAPISDATIRANAAFMQCAEVWDQLAKQDRSRVHSAGWPRDLMSPREIGAMFQGGAAA